MNPHLSDFSSNGFCSKASMQNNLYSQNHGQQVEIQKQLEKTFDQFFRYFTLLVIIGASISALRIRETGLLFSYPLQWLCVLMLVFVVLFKRKIPFQSRVAMLWISGMLFGAIGIFAHGLLGQGFLVLLLCCVVATIGGQRLHGYIVSGLSTIVAITAGIAFNQGWLTIHVNPSTYIVSIVPWITTASAILIVSLLVANFLSNVKELWLKNINTVVINEAKYHLLFESAADAIFIMQEDKFVDCNEKALEIFGSTREQLIGETPSSFSPEKQPGGQLSSEKALEKLSAAMNGKPQLFEWSHFRYDGTPFEAEVSLNRLDVGDNTYIQAITRDITKRKNAERELQKKERQQSLILHSLPMAFYIAKPFDEYGGSWVSEQIEAITGFPPEQLISDKGFWASRLHPEDKQQTIEAFKNIYEQEVIEPVYRWQVADGSYKWFRDVAALIRDENGKPKEIVGTWVDITEHKQMQAEIITTSTKYMEMADMVPLIIFETDSNVRIVFHNRYATELLGYSKEDFDEEISAFNIVAPEDRERAVENYKNIIAGDASSANEYNLIRKDGSRFPGIIYSRPKKSAGINAGVWSCIVDISERQKAEEEKETLVAQLRQAQKLEAIGTLAGGIAHDFNNILTPLLLHTEMSLLELSDDSSVSNHLKEVKTAGHRAANLVKQILEFSRKSEPERIHLQFNLICKEVIKFIKSSLPANIVVEQNLQDTSYVLADPVQMHQVILNLCTNAAHAMKEEARGILEINLTKIKLAGREIPSHPELKPGNYLKLSVSDSGHGMTDDIQQLIFDPFFTTKGREEGTGLGLSVVHGIVTSHGGAITVESSPGKGSVFSVYLPVLEKYSATEAAENLLAPTGSERILFVDDEAVLVEASKELLTKLGYDVIDCTDPHECLGIFKKNPNSIDLIVTDITMPGMTGIDLVKEIYKIRPNIPVIIISGLIDDRTEMDIRSLGIKKVVFKPITMSNLAIAIRDALENI